MAGEGTGVKVSTPAPCKAQRRQFWKLASTPEEEGLPAILEVLEVVPGLECFGVQPPLLSLGICICPLQGACFYTCPLGPQVSSHDLPTPPGLP